MTHARGCTIIRSRFGAKYNLQRKVKWFTGSILYHNDRGLTLVRALGEEGITVTKAGVWYFLKINASLLREKNDQGDFRLVLLTNKWNITMDVNL